MLVLRVTLTWLIVMSWSVPDLQAQQAERSCSTKWWISITGTWQCWWQSWLYKGRVDHYCNPFKNTFISRILHSVRIKLSVPSNDMLFNVIGSNTFCSTCHYISLKAVRLLMCAMRSFMLQYFSVYFYTGKRIKELFFFFWYLIFNFEG